MEYSPPDSSVHGDSLGKNTGVGCHALLQGIFPTQGLNPDPTHCRWIFYHLTQQGSPKAYIMLSNFISGNQESSGWEYLGLETYPFPLALQHY